MSVQIDFLFYIMVACLVTSIVWLIRKRRYIIMVWSARGETSSLLLQFEKEVLEMQKLAQKTREEREVAQCDDDFLFLDHALVQLSRRGTLALDKVVEDKRLETDLFFERSGQAVDDLRQHIALCSDEVRQSLLLSEQTDSIEEVMDEVTVSEISRTIQEVREDLEEEARVNWQQVTPQVFAMAVDAVRKRGKEGALSRQAGLIEKKLLDVMLYLERQQVNVQAVCKTLSFFDRKFVNFRDTCGVRWKRSCAKYDLACRRVHDAQTSMNRSCEFLTHASDVLLPRLLELQSTPALQDPESVTLHRISDIVSRLLRDLSLKLQGVEAECRRRLEEASRELEAPGRRLLALMQVAEDIHMLSDMVPHIARVTAEGSKKEGGRMK